MPYADVERRREYNREYCRTHREKFHEKAKRYRASHKDHLREKARREQQTPRGKLYRANYMAAHPEYQILIDIRQRCGNPNNPAYRWYGERGIKCQITRMEIRYLWNRDRAFLLQHPSIDRIDSTGNYEIGNCRFIELSENGTRALHP